MNRTTRRAAFVVAVLVVAGILVNRLGVERFVGLRSDPIAGSPDAGSGPAAVETREPAASGEFEPLRDTQEPAAAAADAKTDAAPDRYVPDCVYGDVHDEAGRPIADAEIRLRRPNPDLDSTLLFGELLEKLRSDEAGRFTSGPVRPFDHFELHVDAARFAPWWQPVAAGRPIDVVLAAGAAVHGRVVEAGTGAPLSGINVAWTLPRSIEPRGTSVMTDGEGSFLLASLPIQAEIDLLVRRAGGWVQRVPIKTRRGETSEEIRFREGRPLHGRIISFQGSAPIAGARIFDGSHGNWTVPIAAGLLLASSDAAGEFAIPDVPTDLFERHVARFRLVVAADGFASTSFTFSPTADGDVVELALPAGVAMAGRVTDDAGQPLAGALVADRAGLLANGEMHGGADDEHPLPGPGLSRPSRHEAAVTDVQGRFALHGLPRVDGDRSLSIEHVECAREVVSLPASAALMDLHFVLPRGAAIEGTVRLDGTPSELLVLWRVADADTFAGGVWADVRGRYRLTGLPAGRVQVAAFPHGLEPSLGQIDPRVDPPVALANVTTEPGSTAEINLDVRTHQGRVAGVVHDRAGRPVPEVWITVCSQAPPWFERAAASGADGRFEVPVFSAPDAKLPLFRIVAKIASIKQVRDAVPADGSEVELVLDTLHPVVVQIVAAANGRPVTQARFVWRRPGDPAYELIDTVRTFAPETVVLGPNGETELRLPEGEIELVAWDAGCQHAPAHTLATVPVPGGGPLRIELPVGHLLAFELTSDATEPPDDVAVLLLREEEFDRVHVASAGECNTNLPAIDLKVDPPLVPDRIEARSLKMYRPDHLLTGLEPGVYFLRSFGRDLRFEPPSLTVPLPQESGASMKVRWSER